MDSFFDVTFFNQTPFHKESLHSTNDYLKEIVSKNNVKEGFSITSDFQTNGRGQLNNVWHSSPHQNILFSFVVFPKKIPLSEIFILNQWISISIITCLEELLKSENISGNLQIKWPNDIFLNNKKIGGILIENSISSNGIEQSIIGIGLNINELDFPANLKLATSLKKEFLQIKWERNNVLAKICNILERNYNLLFCAESIITKKTYCQYLLGYGVERLYKIDNKEVSAQIIDIDPHGRLMLQYEDKSIHYFGMKEIEFIF